MKTTELEVIWCTRRDDDRWEGWGGRWMVITGTLVIQIRNGVLTDDHVECKSRSCYE